MGRKTRILKRTNKFGVKFSNHPRLKDLKEQSAIKTLIIQEKQSEIIEEPVKSEIISIIEEPIKEEIIIKQPTVSKKVIKPKK